jgi:hypothetical protein
MHEDATITTYRHHHLYTGLKSRYRYPEEKESVLGYKTLKQILTFTSRHVHT